MRLRTRATGLKRSKLRWRRGPVVNRGVCLLLTWHRILQQPYELGVFLTNVPKHGESAQFMSIRTKSNCNSTKEMDGQNLLVVTIKIVSQAEKTTPSRV